MDLATVSVLGQVASSIFTGYQQQNLADYQAEVAQKQASVNAAMTRREAEYNAIMTQFETESQIALLDRQLVYLKQATNLNVDTIERTGAKTIGAQRAAFGASGVALGKGSTVDVQRSTMTDTEMEIATTRYQAEIQDQSIRTTQQLLAKRGALTASMYQEIGAYRASATGLGGDMTATYYDMLGSQYLSKGLTGAGASILGGMTSSKGTKVE